MNQLGSIELQISRHLIGLRRFLAAASIGLLAACGGGDVGDDPKRVPLEVTAKATPAYDRDDLYRFFSIAFGAAPGVTYMGQLVEAADYGLSIKQIVNIFTTKPQFLEKYPSSLSNREYAQKLVDNVVGTSATAAAKAEAVEDIVAALSLPDWTRGDITYAIFNNLAKKPADDVKWASTAKKMANQVAYAKHFTETMKADTTDLNQLRAVVKIVNETSSINTAELSTLIQNAVQAVYNVAPIAKAGNSQNATLGSTATLDGSGSFDADGDTLTYAWQITSKPVSSKVSLTSSLGSIASLTADIAGIYFISLTVNDGKVDSVTTTVAVTFTSGVERFTKISNDGNILPSNATNWSCVRDNIRKLTWEVKTDDGGLRDKDWVYTAYESTGINGNGICDVTKTCNQTYFKNAVNSVGLCGYKDWRLPKVTELESLQDSSRSQAPYINTLYFPNTMSGRYWTSTDNLSASNQNVWWVEFSYISSNTTRFRDNQYYVRLVR
jgi:hypothetical protein